MEMQSKCLTYLQNEVGDLYREMYVCCLLLFLFFSCLRLSIHVSIKSIFYMITPLCFDLRIFCVKCLQPDKLVYYQFTFDTQLCLIRVINEFNHTYQLFESFKSKYKNMAASIFFVLFP
jgi:hypothetical protein